MGFFLGCKGGPYELDFRVSGTMILLHELNYYYYYYFAWKVLFIYTIYCHLH